jgi:uroporphyrinogen decarboxylase
MKVFTEAFGPERIIVGLSSPSKSNQLFSPRIFESLALPAHREFHRKLKAFGMKRFVFHICGDQNMNLPLLSAFAVGPDGWQHPSILSFGHEVDILEAAGYLRDDIIMGNLDPAVIQFGHPRKTYELCADLLEKGKKIAAGFILAPGCDMPPRAPAHNVWSMTKAVNTLGWLS